MASGTSELVTQLASGDPKVRVAALDSLKDSSEAEGQLPRVAELLGDSQWTVRQAAVIVFEALGSRGAPEIPRLAKLLASGDDGVASAGARAMGAIGEPAASEFAALEGLLTKRTEDASSFVHSIAGIAAKAPPSLRKPACAACEALKSLGPAAGKAAAGLADCLNDRDAELRAAAAAAMGAIGKEGAKFETKLLELLEDSSPAVVVAAVEALGDLARVTGDSDPIASAAADLLTHSQPAVRAAAAKSLGNMGEENHQFVEDLASLLHDPAPTVRIEAARTLGRCGESGQMYASKVSRLIEDRSPWVRIAACEVLADMGERGACFEEEVQNLFYDEYPEVYDAAASAIEVFASQREKHRVATLANSPTDANASSPAAAPSQVAVDAAASSPVAAPSQVALLFPGQGSQYVKMLQDAQKIPAVAEMLTKAKDILGWDLLDLCLNGPEDKLEQTKYCQPAMYVGGLAGVEVLRQDKPASVDQVMAVAGLSLGEYTALTFAGVLDFETGLRLVKLRGEAMQAAAEASAQLMVSVAGLDKPTLDRLCAEVAGPNDTCQVANFLFPKGYTCAGSKDAMEKLRVKAEGSAGCLQAKALKTSGAFHTKLMEPAKQKLVQALKEVEQSLQSPKVSVYMNVTGKRLTPGTPPSEIMPLLEEQLCNCVLWEPCIKLMIEDGITEFYECGPMKQLTAMMKRIDQSAWRNTTPVIV